VGAFLFSGCGSHEAKVESESSNLKPLMVLYGQFVGQHRGQPPADEAEFKQHIQSAGQATLNSFGVSDGESLFISPRDHKPYVLLYGSVSGPLGPGGQPVVAYEQEGVGGKRYIATPLGAVEEVSDERFRELVPSAK
jgi:hypothetical protein